MSILGYFPNPYPDEVLYSIVARYHHHLKNSSQYQTLRELFSSPKTPISVEFFSRLEMLGETIHHLAPNLTKGYLERYHTTNPLYEPFMKGNTSSLMHRYKKLKNGVPMKEQLHFCPSCLREQLETFGEGYWNRWHQLPGVLVCIKHQRPLLIHPLNVERMPLNDFYLPSDKIAGLQSTLTQTEDLHHYLSICEDISFICQNNVSFLGKGLFEKYLTEIKINDLAIPMKKMKENIATLVLDTYGEPLLNQLQSNPREVDWIHISEKKILTIHPVRQILLMRALSGSVEKFITNDQIFEPFGKGPWICMNPLANHHLELVVNQVDLTIHQSNRKFQGDFCCECGYVYRLRQGEVNPIEVPYFSNRVMEKGTVWKAKFNEMVARGDCQEDIAKSTHLSTPTIRKIIREGFNPIQNGIQKKQLRIEESRMKKTENYRILWTDIIACNPTYSRKAVADLNRAVYSWLHQYDSEWLEVHLPETKRGKGTKKDISYEKEDEVYLEKVKKLFLNWGEYESSLGKPIRKTMTAIVTLIGKYYSIKMKKYPRTLKYVQENVESIEIFQLRKISFVLKSEFSGITVAKYKLLEKTGIRRTIKPSVIPIVEKLIEQHNNEI